MVPLTLQPRVATTAFKRQEKAIQSHSPHFGNASAESPKPAPTFLLSTLALAVVSLIASIGFGKASDRPIIINSLAKVRHVRDAQEKLVSNGMTYQLVDNQQEHIAKAMYEQMDTVLQRMSPQSGSGAVHHFTQKALEAYPEFAKLSAEERQVLVNIAQTIQPGDLYDKSLEAFNSFADDVLAKHMYVHDVEFTKSAMKHYIETRQNFNNATMLFLAMSAVSCSVCFGKVIVNAAKS